MTIYATISDLQARHPKELTLLAADETSGLRDDARVDLALSDASSEIRAILQARYSPADLAALDANSLELLKVYCMDIALYRISLSFSRSNEAVKERYDASIKRLEAIAAGKGALTLTTSGNGGGSGGSPEAGAINQNEVVLVAPDRMFSRNRLGRI
ncbi:MAG: phage protein Gp36 family protein [Rhizobiaceae bacterium]